MKFELNGEIRPIGSDVLTIYQLILDEGVLKTATNEPRHGIAIAVNQKIIPRSQWATHYIQPDDKVDLFQAIAGG